jgi:hypothetical protein
MTPEILAKYLLGNSIVGWPEPIELKTVVIPEDSPFKLSMLVNRYYILQESFSGKSQSYSSKAKRQASGRSTTFSEFVVVHLIFCFLSCYNICHFKWVEEPVKTPKNNPEFNTKDSKLIKDETLAILGVKTLNNKQS